MKLNPSVLCNSNTTDRSFFINETGSLSNASLHTHTHTHTHTHIHTHTHTHTIPRFCGRNVITITRELSYRNTMILKYKSFDFRFVLKLGSAMEESSRPKQVKNEGYFL